MTLPERFTTIPNSLAINIDSGRHLLDTTPREVIVYGMNTPYPDEIEGPLSSILLPRAQTTPQNNDEIIFELPKSYISLPKALNDAFSTENDRSSEFITDVFRGIGQKFYEIRYSGQGVPINLSYRQILVNREFFGFYVAPPLLMAVEGGNKNLDDTMNNSLEKMKVELVNAADTVKRQKRVLGLFSTLTAAIQG